MQRFLYGLFGIQEGELRRTFFLFAYLFLLIASFIIAKSVRDSLFLSEYGVLKLPYVYMGVAILLAVIMTVYTRFTAVIPLPTLLLGSNLFWALGLFAFWWIVKQGFPWAYPTFYIWVNLFGALATVQFWTFAQSLYDVRQAKRVLGVVGAGGILGGAAGGMAANLLVAGWGTENLILLIIVGLLSATAIFLTLQKWEPVAPILPPEREEISVRKDLKEIFSNKLLLTIALVIGLTDIVVNMTDYQFKVLTREAINQKEELTAFFGSFYAVLSLASFVFQIIFTSRIYRRFGLMTGALLMPVGLLAGAFSIVIFKNLWSAIGTKIAEGGFRHSIHRASMELFYSPIPLSLRRKAKPVVDIVFEKLFGGLGGLILLGATSWVGISTPQISYLVVVMVGLWMMMIVFAQRHYTDAFRRALEENSLPLDEDLDLSKAATLEVLFQKLNSTDPRQVLYSLALLRRNKKKRTVPHYLIYHPEREVRRELLRMWQDSPPPGVALLVARRLREENDDEVYAEGILLLGKIHHEALVEQILDKLTSQQPRIRAAAAVVCFTKGTEEEKERARRVFVEMLEAKGAEGISQRIALAEMLSRLPDPSFRQWLEPLLRDEAHEVKLKAIESAGQMRNRFDVPCLIEELACETCRAKSEEALARYGPGILGTLNDYLADETIPLEVRRNIPMTIARIESQDAANILVKRLSMEPGTLRYRVIQALTVLHRNYPHLTIVRRRVEEQLDLECHRYYQRLAGREALQGLSLAVQRQRDTLSKKLDNALARIFQLLGLIYVQLTMDQAYLKLTEDDAVNKGRASAIEYLDNLLPSYWKQRLIPLVDDTPIFHKLEQGRDLYGIKLPEQQGSFSLSEQLVVSEAELDR